MSIAWRSASFSFLVFLLSFLFSPSDGYRHDQTSRQAGG